MSKIRDLAFIDCETTGLDSEQDEIIELAIVRIDSKTFESKDTYHQYFYPTRPVAEEIRAINGYDEALWRERGAVLIHKVDTEQICKILTDTTPAGQNPN